MGAQPVEGRLMPRVERYTHRQVATRPLPGVRRQAAETFASAGGPQAEGVAGFGADATRVGLAISQAERQRADQVALTTAERQLGELEHQLATDREHGFQSVKGKEVLGLRSKSLELFDQQADMIASNLTSDPQRQAYTRARERRRVSLLEGIERHTSSELAAYDKGEASAGITTAANLAIANADKPVRIAEELARIDNLVETYAGVLGVTGPEARQAFVSEIRSKVHVGVVERLIGLDRDQDAQAYFEEVTDPTQPGGAQLSGAALGHLEEKLQLATTDGEALRASEDIWATLGPTDDADEVELDTMEAEARRRFAGNTKVLRATIDWIRQRKAGVDSGRKEREDAVLSDVWGAVMDGQSMTEIRRMPAFVSAPGRVQIQVRDYYQRQIEHQANLAYQQEARASARESRAATAEARAERRIEMASWASYAADSDPKVLATLTRADILAKLPVRGIANTQRLLTDLEQFQRAGSNVEIERDLFNEIMVNADQDYALKTPGQRTEVENAQYGRMLATVNDALAAAGGKLDRNAQRAIMESIVDQKVMIDDGWFSDSETIAAVVNTDDRRAVYVPLDQIDAAGQPYKDALNYLRGLPLNAQRTGGRPATDNELRAWYGTRIEKAIGRSRTGGTRQVIEDALKGVN